MQNSIFFVSKYLSCFFLLKLNLMFYQIIALLDTSNYIVYRIRRNVLIYVKYCIHISLAFVLNVSTSSTLFVYSPLFHMFDQMFVNVFPML